MALTSRSILEPSYGAHPTIITSIELREDLTVSNNATACSLYLHYTLPPLLFVDPFELSMRQRDYQVVRITGRGARELERPVHALPLARGDDIAPGVEVVVEKPLHAGLVGDVEVQLPIHLRYGEPTTEPYAIQAFNVPTVVLACPFASPQTSHCEGTKLGTEPITSFSTSLIGCLTSPSTRGTLEISVPLGNTQDLPVVELGTSAVILTCFAWISWGAWRANLRLQVGKSKSE